MSFPCNPPAVPPDGSKLLQRALWVKDVSVEVMDQVVKYQHIENHGGLCCPEAIHGECGQSEAFFEVFDDVFVVGPGTIFSPDPLCFSLLIVGYHQAHAVILPLIHLLEKRGLFARGLGPCGYGLPDHNIASWSIPFGIQVLKSKFPYFNAWRHRLPALYRHNGSLKNGKDGSRDDVEVALFLKVLYEFNVIKTTVANHTYDTKARSQTKDALRQELHSTLPCVGISGSVPQIDHIAAAQKSHQRMMREAAGLLGIVSLFGPLLVAVTGDNAGVQMERVLGDRFPCYNSRDQPPGRFGKLLGHRLGMNLVPETSKSGGRLGNPLNTKGPLQYLQPTLPPTHMAETTSTGQHSQKLSQHFPIDPLAVIGDLPYGQSALHPPSESDRFKKFRHHRGNTAKGGDGLSGKFNFYLIYAQRCGILFSLHFFMLLVDS